MFKRKIDRSRRYRSALIGVLGFVVVNILLPISGAAQCARIWDATGDWKIRQGARGSTVVQLSLEQSGSAISGTAIRNEARGNVLGDADGDSFSISIDWLNGGEMSIYRARISAAGKLQGETSIGPNKRNPETWYGEVTLTCPTGPIRSTGRIKPFPRLSANAPAQPGQATQSVVRKAFVVARPYFPTIYEKIGFADIAWDAGADHPNAELWVKYDGSRERSLLFKVPTGTQRVGVNRGRIYTYVLMDGRRVLAEVTFVAQ